MFLGQSGNLERRIVKSTECRKVLNATMSILKNNQLRRIPDFKARARAPLRLGLAGGGTDVSPFCDLYGGTVMNATINRFIYASACYCVDNNIEFQSHDLIKKETFRNIDDIRLDEGILPLHRAVYKRIMKDYFDGASLPIRLATYSEAPAGSGLGSSSTLVVSLVAALADLLSLPLGEYDIAALAYSIEREDLRFGGGRQDQYAAAFGGFNFMEFFSDNVVVVNPLRIKQKFINELQLQTILCFTGVSRESAKIIEEQTDNVKKGDSKSIEAMLKLKATAVEMKNAILHGDIAAVSAALCSGWTSKKAMSNSITNTLIDNAVSDALNAGATAGKVSGAGGGGFIMLLVPLEYRRNVLSVLCEKHFRTETIQFTSEGVVTWHV